MNEIEKDYIKLKAGGANAVGYLLQIAYGIGLLLIALWVFGVIVMLFE